MIERKVSAGVLFALSVQTCGAFAWAGAAAQRISALEDQVEASRPVTERLVRVESELEAVRAQLLRIEAKVDQL